MENSILTNNISIKKERNYGIDALRLISMLMVVILHVLGFCGVLQAVTDFTLKGELLHSLQILCYGAVNIYAIISGFVGYRSSHKGSNLIYLSIQLLFFSLVITGIDLGVMINQGAAVSAKDVFFNVFSSIKMHWYFSAYFCLFFFMPLLDKMIEHTPRKILKGTALFCFIVFCGFTQFNTQVAYLQGGYSFLWLALLYALGAYISKYQPLKRWSALHCALGFFACSAITILSRFFVYALTQSSLVGAEKINILVSYTSPTVLLGAIFLVCAFSKIRFKHSAPKKIVAFLCPMAFGVYLIHCHPIVAEKLTGAFAWIGGLSAWLVVPAVLGVGMAVFCICLFIDWIRLLLFKLFKIKELSCLISRLIKKLVDKMLKNNE